KGCSLRPALFTSRASRRRKLPATRSSFTRTQPNQKSEVTMGWGRMLLLGNVGQQMDIGDLENAIGEMQHAVREKDETDLSQTRSIRNLELENQGLKLYLATLIRLLVAKGVLNATEVETIVRAIDAG